MPTHKSKDLKISVVIKHNIFVEIKSICIII